MSRFSAAFLLVFAQLGWGGLLALAVPPFPVLDRGFYRSSAGIFLGFSLVFLVGRLVLVWRAGSMTMPDAAEMGAWAAFTIGFALYAASLWGESAVRRARSFTATLGLGLLALTVTALRWRVAPGVLTALVYPAAFASGALVLGAVAAGMLLGHWYLIDLGLSIDPLRRLLRWYVVALVVQLLGVSLAVGLLALGPPPAAAAVRTLFASYPELLALRLLLGPLPALVLGWLIHRTLAIPQTMAATGLFYVAILAVMVGELLGKLVLYRTGVPL